MLRTHFFVAVALWIFPLAANAQSCTEIRFAPGTYGTEINGVAPADGAVCFKLSTGIGQTVKLRILQGRNTTFSIIGVADARDAFTFKTEAKEYRILIAQLMRSVTDEPFRLAVEVR